MVSDDSWLSACILTHKHQNYSDSWVSSSVIHRTMWWMRYIKRLDSVIRTSLFTSHTLVNFVFWFSSIHLIRWLEIEKNVWEVKIKHYPLPNPTSSKATCNWLRFKTKLIGSLLANNNGLYAGSWIQFKIWTVNPNFWNLITFQVKFIKYLLLDKDSSFGPQEQPEILK